MSQMEGAEDRKGVWTGQDSQRFMGGICSTNPIIRLKNQFLLEPKLLILSTICGS